MLDLINQFGGRKDVFLFGAFIVLLFLISSFIKGNKRRVIFSILASLFICLQAFSLYFTQSFIGYQFYIHFNLRGVTGMYSLFIVQIITLTICFLIILLLNYYSYYFIKRIKKERLSKNFRLASIVSILLIIFIQGNFINDSRTLITILFSSNNSSDFEEVLSKYDMSGYVMPSKIKSTAGKNIIIISLESLEKGFLSEKYASLTPNLNKLKENWNYYDIHPNIGSGWTSGSLYTYLTGFPAFFEIRSNNIFHATYDSKISSVSHVLEKANYQTTYMNGNTDHSGVKNMLNSLNFDKVIDAKNAKKYGSLSVYGLRDKDLFDLAKDEIQNQKNSENPFALFISTTDTHNPEGIYDSRMESVISRKNSDLEFMVAAVDYMIGDLISYLKKNNLLENTAIFIFPDHLKMGNPKMFKNTGNRGLYLITNSKNSTIGMPEKLYQIDLPKMILNGGEIKHNLKFFTDYISGDKNQYIQDNINEITEINSTGLSRINVEKYTKPVISKQYNEYKKDTRRYIAHAGGKIDEYTYTNSLEALDLNYAKGFRLFELDILKTIDGQFVAAHDWVNWRFMSGFVGDVPVTLDVFMKYKLHEKYTPLGMKEINEWFKNHPDAILITDKINEPKLFAKEFIDPNRLMMELFSIEALEEGVQTEILSAMPSQRLIQNLDWESILRLKIKHAVISRFFIKENKKLLKKLKENNVKVFIYGINKDEGLTNSGLDEDYVTKYELDYVFGMYADSWSFE